jgi:RNA polymerase sigma-70 factor (ECF subfamily)
MPDRQRKAIAEFFAREKDNLVRYVRRMIDDAAERDSEDIIQDVMLGIFERSDVTEPIGDLSAYVYRSLYNRVVDGYRKKRRTVSLDAPAGTGEGTLADVIADAGADVHDEVERTHTLKRMYAAIDELSPPQKSVLIATEFEGRAFRELSEEWGVPLGTLLATKHRAIKTLRTRLGVSLRDGKEKHSAA